MRRFIFIAVALTVPSIVFATLTKGPYLQNVSKHQITIGWETTDPAPGTLFWGNDPANLNNQASSAPIEFSYKGGVLYNHWVTLTNLERATTYYYKIEGVDYSSDVYMFTTAPKNTQPFKFVIFGDSQGGSIDDPNEAHEMVVDAVLGELPAFVVRPGDLVSSGKSLADWEYFFHAEKELIAITPFFPVVGNHDDNGVDSDTGVSGEQNFIRLFRFPAPRDGATWYSFDYANVHFIVVNIEKELTLIFPSAEQMLWLTADLQAAINNPYTNFIFVSYHEPAFSWKEGRGPNFIAKYILDPIFQQYGVNLIFTGHNHHYAHAFFNDMDHIITGGGGSPLYDFVDNVESKPGYRMHDKSYHYCLVEVNGQQAKVTAIRAQDGSIIETFSVYSPYPVVPEPDDDDDTADDDSTDDDTSNENTSDDAELKEDTGCGC